MLEDFHAWAKQLEGVFTKLVAVPAEVNFALDPNFATLYPYRSSLKRGEPLPLELRVTNHGPRAAEARAVLAVPPGWETRPAEAVTEIGPGETGVLPFVVSAAPDATGRAVLCADLTLGGRRFGQVTEALVDVAR